MANGSTSVILKALAANVGIATAKFAGAAFTGSVSLFAEAIHSTADCLNQILLLVGARRSLRPPTERHPLGYGRETFFWSFVVAILLFSMGGMFAVYEGLHKLHAPEPVRAPVIPLVILLVSIGLEWFSFSAALEEVKRTNVYGSLWKWFRRTTQADLVVIFTEDLAALVGLVLAAIALSGAWITGDGRWDAWGSVAIGALLLCVSVLLAREVQSLLIGEVPEKDYRAPLQALLDAHLPSSRVLRLIAVQSGAANVLLAYKLSSPDGMLAKDLILGVNQVELAMRKQFPEIQWQFAEPDFEA